MTTTGAVTTSFRFRRRKQPGDIARGPTRTWFAESWATRSAASKRLRLSLPAPSPSSHAVRRAAKKKICKVPKLKGSTAKQARKKLKRAGCQFRLRGRGRVTRSKPKAGARTTKRVQVTLKQKRRKAKKAVTRRLLAVKGGLQQ